MFVSHDTHGLGSCKRLLGLIRIQVAVALTAWLPHSIVKASPSFVNYPSSCVANSAHALRSPLPAFVSEIGTRFSLACWAWRCSRRHPEQENGSKYNNLWKVSRCVDMCTSRSLRQTRLWVLRGPVKGMHAPIRLRYSERFAIVDGSFSKYAPSPPPFT